MDPLFSTVYLWEQPEEENSGPLLSLEEQILNSTFEACDPHKTGGGWGSTGRARLGPSLRVLQEQDNGMDKGMSREGLGPWYVISLWPGYSSGCYPGSSSLVHSEMAWKT